jgi:uncharacterized protein
MLNQRFKMKIIAKTHLKDGKTLVAVCDKNLLGRVFEEDDCVLDLSTDFYSGDEFGEEEVGDLIRNADIVNIVGASSIKLGIEEDVIDEESVKTIEGIPYAIGILINHE